MPHGMLDLEDGAEESFSLGGDHEITVTFRRTAGSKGTLLTAVGRMTISEEMRAIVASPTATTTLPDAKALEAFVDNELNVSLRRTVALARWRIGSSGPHDPWRVTSGRARYWSLDGAQWHEFPLGLGRLNLRAEAILKWRPEVKTSFAELLRAGETEPTAYNLLMEALEQGDSNPRSALVIGVAALEIGVKQCIADLAPATEWLLTNLASPPVVDLLCDYLPTLEAKIKVRGGKPLAPPKAIRRTIRSAVEARNSLVHRSGVALKDFDLEEALKAIRDVLFLLEFYQGHEWAWTCVRHETMASMLAEASLA